MLLEGKTAIVTGAGRGIGRGIAVAFAKQGCNVAITARTDEELEDAAAEIRGLGRTVFAESCDVSVEASVDRLVQNAAEALGGIDILVNNAGYACFKPFEELTTGDWQQTFDVNVTAVFYCIRAVLPSMKQRGAGRIINISSVAGLKPIENQSAYCASKHALEGLSHVLAMELRPYQIGVHTICPGGVHTRLADEAMPERDKSEWMTPEDIAHAALYLASLSPRAATDSLVVRRFQSVPIGG
jgi:NAD(P)-dependent dehydrogenase (short-subunit alcohol dehydrogenase family)